jgi:copper resistance protein C
MHVRVSPGNSTGVTDDKHIMRTWTRAAAAGALGLVVTMLLPAAPASAHVRLRASNPAANSTVTTAVSAITLTFSDTATQPTVTVTGADGRNVGSGPAQVSGVTVTQAVGALAAGVVTVAWRVVSPDGDPVDGTFTFTNSAPAAAPAPSATPSTPAAVPTNTATGPTSAPTADAAPRSADESGVSPLWWVGAGILVLAAIGGGAVWFRRRRA